MVSVRARKLIREGGGGGEDIYARRTYLVIGRSILAASPPGVLGLGVAG